MGVLWFVRVISVAPWWSSGSFGFVGFILLRREGRWIQWGVPSWLSGPFGFVGFIQSRNGGRRVHWIHCCVPLCLSGSLWFVGSCPGVGLDSSGRALGVVRFIRASPWGRRVHSGSFGRGRRVHSGSFMRALGVHSGSFMCGLQVIGFIWALL